MKTLTTAMALTALITLGCKGSETPAAPPALPTTATAQAGGTVPVLVDGDGYHPAEVRAPAGARITLAFRRTTDECCGQQLRIPSMQLQRDLPLNVTVPIEVTVPASGALAFTCGMNMYRGSVVVR
jgi:plastocyanin domain-containing protein